VPQTEIAPARRSGGRTREAPERLRRQLRPPRAPDAITIEQSRGRLEKRELWVVEAGDEGPYLAEEVGWQGVAQIGWLPGWRKRRVSELWTVEEVTIVRSRGVATATPWRVLQECVATGRSRTE
jgi:hypothetical protein